MAFPWTFGENFELAGIGTFDSEVDTGSILDFPHYSTLARFGMAPYRGAYAMRIRLNGGTTSAYVREDTSFDLAASGNHFIRFYFYLGKDFIMADTDKFSLIEGESTLDTTTEYAAGIDRSGDNIRLWIAETAAATAQTVVLGTTTTALGRWYSLEFQPLIDSGAPGDGTLAGWLDDAQIGSTITALDQGAIVDAKIGVIGPDAGTSGTILIDQVLVDNVRIGRYRERFSDNIWVHYGKDHAFVGPGEFTIDVETPDVTGTCVMYDTDGVATVGANGPEGATDWGTGSLAPIGVIKFDGANESFNASNTYRVNHGLYIIMAGSVSTTAWVHLRGGSPALSEAAYINRGIRQGGQRP